MEKKTTRIYGVLAVAALWLLLAVWAWVIPSRELSEAERRKLEAFPSISSETLLSGKFMSKFETYTQDQFPLRDSFRQLKAIFSYKVLHKGDNNGIYLADGFAAKLEYPLNVNSVTSAVKKFQKIYDLYLKDSTGKMVFSVVPDKGYYLAEANGYPAMDYEALFREFEAIPWAQYVDITDCLTAESYYATDTHWRQEKIGLAAKKLAQALDAWQPAEYQTKAVERPFYGVYYGQAALPMEPETLYVLENEVLDGCVVTNHETGAVSGVYDWNKLTSRDLYDVFLSGPVSVLTIENPAAEGERELIVFRDSFGSSLIPLLVQEYAKITVLDIRYVPTAYLEQFVEFGNQDVLFLYSTLVLNNSAMLK